ncbi:hypothetical protein bcere0029_30620 [Bacillus cereus AH1272]|nr:hypothetical protein bcere0029_30620 [Bacillus cereus AH1272]
MYDGVIFEKRTKKLLTIKVNNEVNIKVIQTKANIDKNLFIRKK